MHAAGVYVLVFNVVIDFSNGGPCLFVAVT